MHVVVRAQDRNGDWYEYEGEDIVARCFLHEIDHLDGHMYTRDRRTDAHAGGAGGD